MSNPTNGVRGTASKDLLDSVFNEGNSLDFKMSLRLFANTTNYNNMEFSWWEDCQIEWAIDQLQTLFAADQTIHMATINEARTVWHMFRDHYNPDRADASPPDTQERSYLDDVIRGKDILILPVNDGYAATVGDVAGLHWSLVVIDRLNNRARYADSLVGISSEGGITGTTKNAEVAGKMVYAFDRFIGLQPKESFDTRTLTGIPHQENHNSTKHDHGACGPYLYAFARCIMGRRHLINDDLSRSFLREDLIPGQGHKNFRFDSYRARSQVRDWIFQDGGVRWSRKPEISKQLAKDIDLPVTAEKLEIYGGNWTSKDHQGTDDENGDDKEDPIPSSHDSSPPDEEDSPPRDPPSIPPSSIPPSSPKGRNAPKKKRFNEEDVERTMKELKVHKIYAKAYLEGLSRLEPNGSVERTLEAAYDVPPRNPDYNRLAIPPDFNALPRDFADEQAVTNEDLEKWTAHGNNKALLLMKLAKKDFKNKPESYISIRARLQVLSGQAFEDESEERLRNIWFYDPKLTKESAKGTAKAVRDQMVDKYGSPVDPRWFPSPSSSGENDGSNPPPSTDNPRPPVGSKRKRGDSQSKTGATQAAAQKSQKSNKRQKKDHQSSQPTAKPTSPDRSTAGKEQDQDTDGADMSGLSQEDLDKKTKKVLSDYLKKVGQRYSGTKPELIRRIQIYHSYGAQKQTQE